MICEGSGFPEGDSANATIEDDLSLYWRIQLGCGSPDNKMSVCPHAAAFPGSEGPRQPSPRTQRTAPDSTGQRAQAPAPPPLRLPHTIQEATPIGVASGDNVP